MVGKTIKCICIFHCVCTAAFVCLYECVCVCVRVRIIHSKEFTYRSAKLLVLIRQYSTQFQVLAYQTSTNILSYIHKQIYIYIHIYMHSYIYIYSNIRIYTIILQSLQEILCLNKNLYIQNSKLPRNRFRTARAFRLDSDLSNKTYFYGQ